MEKGSNNEKNDKICLAFDATNRWITAGIFGPLEKEINIEANRDSFTRLTQVLSDLMRESGIIQPDWIITTIGPGSFTGTKISVTAARTLSLLWKIPVLGVDSLTFYMNAVREEIPENSPAGVLIDAKQKKVYAKLSGCGIDSSSSSNRENELLDISPDILFEKTDRDMIFFGDDPLTISGYLTKTWPHIIRPFPELKARSLYKTGIDSGGFQSADTYENLIPLYLRQDPATDRYPEGLKK